ncbi:MAG: glycoside hydrolase family 3 C-terminal domain-containing protein [Eudoraea sp.]
MKKPINKGLKVLLAIVILILIVAALGYYYLNSTFLNFEKDYSEKNIVTKEININGFTFFDRNNNGKLDVYEDSRESLEARVENLLSQMTIAEKIHILKGSGLKSAMGMDSDGIPGAVGTIVPTPRLGIPTIYLSDGPAGLRIEPIREGENKTYYCTAFPIATLIASTWNTDLANQVGDAMGNEALEYGIDVILGPGANIHRNPLCGRNFEYYSEDPVLTGKIGAALVRGIEANGIGTSVKHFVANNQETNRNFNDVIVSERAMREIYLKGFEIIVKDARPTTVMSSYNKVNGTYTSESDYLLTQVLRRDWGFNGIVMSDWFGGRDAPAQIKAGNDLLEPGTKKQWAALEEAVESGELSTDVIDTAARRILKLILKSKKMQGYQFGNNPDLKKNAQIARRSASEGMVLLKNNSALPMKNVKNIALIGVTSYEFIAGGTGSGDVNEAYTVSLEEGLKNAGYTINEVAKQVFEKHKAANEDAFVKPEGMKAMFEPYDPPEITLSEDELRQTASSANLAIITIGRNSGEGGDRIEQGDFLLTEQELEMIRNTCRVFHAVGKKVIVVLNIGGVIETTSWKEQPDAILLAWQGGQEGGNSVADILSGKINPSGKLPMTFPINLSDHASSSNFPMDGDPIEIISMFFDEDEKTEEELIRNKDYTLYEEGVYVGYRHFDKSNLDVSYPFGFGLSYTKFTYDDMNVMVTNDTIKLDMRITNSGDMAGKEVVQVYIEKPSSNIDRPIQELKAFAKTPLMAIGESKEMTFSIPAEELAYWNETISQWAVEPGTYTIRLGSSSREIELLENIELLEKVTDQ